MASIRIKKTTEPSTPPSGRSRLFVDVADDHFKRKKDDGSIVDYDIGLTPEAIQDAVGAMVTDTATIDLTYNDAADELSADIVAESITDAQVYQISPTKIGDVNNSRYKATITTTTSSYATAFTMDASSDGTFMVEASTTCARTGGTAGAAGDGAAFKRTFRVKSIGGVVTIHDMQSDYTSRDSTGMRVQYLVSGTDILFRVGGVTNNNLRWVLDISTNKNN